MNKIEIETRDGKIWNSHEKIIEIIRLSKMGPVQIDMLHEGPCLTACGLESILDLVCENFGFDPGLYTITTSNQIPSSHYKEIKTGFVELEFVKDKAKKLDHWTSSLNKKFGIFISRSNWLRLGIASYLHDKCADDTVMTFHYDPTSDYHLANFGLEDFVARHPLDIHVFDFIKILPIKQGNYSYPISWNTCALEMSSYYSQMFCDVVCETYFTGDTFFLTEKTLRPIMYRRPFLIQGPPNFLMNLKRLGFKTFDSWWDEGYDEDAADFKYQAIKHNIDYIAGQSKETIHRWYQEMQGVLDHNYQCLLNLTPQQIANTRFSMQN